MFVFGDFNIHHKDWLTYYGGNDRPDELCFNFSISKDLTRMLSFPILIPTLKCCSFGFLSFFISSDASLSTMAFPRFGNSDHIIVSISIGFLSNSKEDIPLHCIAYDCSCAE